MPGTRKSTTHKSSSPRKKLRRGTGGSSKNGSRFSTGKILAATAGLAAAATAGAVLYRTKGDSSGSNGRTVYHVQPDGDGWAVKGAGAERAVSTHGTKKEALTAGRELAHNQVPSQLVVHKSDGKIQESWSYERQ